MKKIIYIAISILLFASCYTAKKAQRQVIKAHLNHPIVTSGFCATTFPIKDSVIEKIKFIPGKVVVKKDTITIDCDSVVKDTTKSNQVLVKYRNIYKTDTIVKEKLVVKENTAKISNLELNVNRLEAIKTNQEETIKDLKKSKNKYRNYLFGLIGVIAVILFEF